MSTTIAIQRFPATGHDSRFAGRLARGQRRGLERSVRSAHGHRAERAYEAELVLAERAARARAAEAGVR